MKLRTIATLFAFAVASAAAAHAQAGLYATFSAEQFTRNGLTANASSGSNSDSPFLYGPTVGAFYTVSHVPMMGKYGNLHTGPFALGLDGRGMIMHGSLYSRSDAIISLRVSTKKPVMRLSPYVQGGAGLAHIKLPHAPYYTNNWSYQFALGADRKLKGRVDWRVFEGSAGFVGDYIAGLAPGQSNYNYTLSTGLVVRMSGK